MLRTSSGWRSNISAIRYSPIALSVPENLIHEEVRVRVTSQRDHGQAQTSLRALRAFVQGGRPGIGQMDLRSIEQFTGLARGEAQIAGAKLGDLVDQPEPVESDRRIAARRQHRTRRFRKNAQQAFKLEGASADRSSWRSSMTNTVIPAPPASSETTVLTITSPSTTSPSTMGAAACRRESATVSG